MPTAVAILEQTPEESARCLDILREWCAPFVLVVVSPERRSKPDRVWLSEQIKHLQPFNLLLVCGEMSQGCYNPFDAGKARIIELPHPAARMWTRNTLALVGRVIQQGEGDCCLSFSQGRLISEPFIPF